MDNIKAPESVILDRVNRTYNELLNILGEKTGIREGTLKKNEETEVSYTKLSKKNITINELDNFFMNEVVPNSQNKMIKKISSKIHEQLLENGYICFGDKVKREDNVYIEGFKIAPEIYLGTSPVARDIKHTWQFTRYSRLENKEKEIDSNKTK